MAAQNEHDELRQAVVDTAGGLFGDRVTKSMLDDAERGVFPRELWDAVAELGLVAAPLAEEGGGLGGLRAASALFRPAGFHALPLPYLEAMLASWLLGSAGMAIPTPLLSLTAAPLSLAKVSGELRVSGSAPNVPWARDVEGLVALAELDGVLHVVRVSMAGAAITRGSNVAAEPRDTVGFDGVAVAEAAPSPIDRGRLGEVWAAARAALMTGAIERVLEMTVEYAKDRVQFGKPIAKFQAIQHQIAVMANHTAASVMAAERALDTIERSDGGKFAAIAKVRVGEAASEAARVAHQVHAAMGFTHEHILHHFTRRLWSWRDEQGSEAHWARVLGDAAIAGGADRLWDFVGEAAAA